MEVNRTDDNLFTIYLNQDKPDSEWYSAIEWSAYLLEFYPNNLDDNQRITPLHTIDDNKDIIHVGLKASSFSKYLPGVDINTDSIDKISIILDSSKYPSIDLQNYPNKLSEWKSSVPIKSKKVKSKDKINTVFSTPATFSSIMKMILSYDTHNKSEDDLRTFILNLKSRCASMI